MFIALLSHERFADFDLTSVRTGIMAGAPPPEEVMKRSPDLPPTDQASQTADRRLRG
jgi:hypothetical protein